MVAPLISVMAAFFSLIMALSILTLNCNGIRDQSKRAGLVQWLRSLPVGADIVCLQETHCLSSAECSSWFLSSGFSAVVSPGSSHSCGCIVLFRPLLSLVNSWCDVLGRYLQVEFSFFGKSFRVCCVYAPNRNPARTSSLLIFIPRLIPRSLQFFVGISTKFSTAPWIVRVAACPSPSVTVLPHLNISSKTVVSSISGGISTLPLPVLPGPGGMAVWRPVLIFLVCRFRGCLLFLRVILSLVLFRTIVVCVSRSRSPMLFPLVRAFGNSTLLF